MSNKYHDFKTLTLGANQTEKIPVRGNHITCTGATGAFTAVMSDGSRYPMNANFSYDTAEYDFIEITDTTGSSNTITIVYGFGEANFATQNSVTVSGTVTASGDNSATKETDEDAGSASAEALLRGILHHSKPSDTLSTTSDVAVTGNGKSSLSSANTSRKRIVVKNLAGNTNVFRVGDTNVSASRGVEIAAGEKEEFFTTAEVFAHQIGTGESLSITEEVYNS